MVTRVLPWLAAPRRAPTSWPRCVATTQQAQLLDNKARAAGVLALALLFMGSLHASCFAKLCPQHGPKHGPLCSLSG